MNIKELQIKVNEVKSLFTLAQRILPFMEELFEFINETTPLLEDINLAIKDNLKKMPNATKQLTKVTQATEMASTEIMDTVDRVNDELYKVISDLENYKSIQAKSLVNPLQLLETIAECISTGKDLAPLLDDINLFIERTRDISNKEHSAIINDIISRVNDISNDANTIINSLQVQDITSQQLAAVNHLLENIQGKLSSIMQHLDHSEDVKEKPSGFDESIKISRLHRDIAFDPDAVDSMTAENRQSNIDAMLADPSALLGEIEEASSESADNIINAAFNATKAAPVAEEDVSEEFSQDDIDALFN